MFFDRKKSGEGNKGMGKEFLHYVGTCYDSIILGHSHGLSPDGLKVETRSSLEWV
jgi:hypothetical protein